VITAEFTSMETLALLERLRIPVLQLDGFNRFESYAWHVRDIAGALGVEARGHALIEAFEARRRALEAPATRLGDRPAIVSWQEGTVAGTGTIFAEQADAAGFRLLPAEHGITGHQSVALETLVAWDPRWIAIACTELDESACKATEREFAARPGIAATRAAREDGVIAVPSRILYSTGTGMLDVVEWLAARRQAGQ
jgi:iron complex transport system substrate-binding protein